MAILFAIVLAATVAATPTDINTTFKPLKFREIGPAVMGGRIDAFAANVSRDVVTLIDFGHSCQ